TSSTPSATATTATPASTTTTTGAPTKPRGGEPSGISLDPTALTVTLPLYKGATASGKPTYYVVTDASIPALAHKYGVNNAAKLTNTLGTKAVQTVHSGAAGIIFPGT